MVMFGVIFFRLWYLQILSGEQYVQQANANRVRDLPIPAPRGRSSTATARRWSPAGSPTRSRSCPRRCPRPARPRLALYVKLGRLLGMTPGHVQALVIRGRTELPYAPITIKTDAGPGVLTVLGERASQFPGVLQKPVSIRDYPWGEMAAQVLGYVGDVSKPAQDEGLPRGPAGHDRGPGRARVLLRPLSAWHPRDANAWRSTQRLPGSQPARPDPAEGRPRAAGDARHGPAEGERKGAPAGHRQRSRERQAGGRRGVRCDGPAQRRNPLDRLLPPRSTPTASPNRSPSPNTNGSRAAARRPGRSPTGPSTAPIRPAPRSSRSPPWRRSKAA